MRSVLILLVTLMALSACDEPPQDDGPGFVICMPDSELHSLIQEQKPAHKWGDEL